MLRYSNAPPTAPAMKEKAEARSRAIMVRIIYQGLVGVTIGSGWRKAVQACVGSVKGCTHVRELLFPMATVAFQTIGSWQASEGAMKESPIHRGGRPYFIDGCIGWAADGEVVATLHPEFAKSASA